MVINLNNEYMLKHIYEVVAKNNQDIIKIWTAHIVFTWRWWLGVLLAIVPWIIWVKFADKKQAARLLFIGLIVALITDFLDTLGLCLGLWYYEWKVVPVTPVYLPWNFALFPVIIMLLLQFKSELNRFIKAFGFAFFAAFISEPVFTWLGMYVIVNWKHWYSFIIYIPLYLLFDGIYNSKLLSQCRNS